MAMRKKKKRSKAWLYFPKKDDNGATCFMLFPKLHLFHLRYHMENGVSLMDPDQTYIEPDVSIGADTIIEPGCIIKGNTKIGNSCVIGYNSKISNSTIGAEAHIESSPLPAAPCKSYITITAKCLQIAFININPRQSKFLYYRNNL